MRTLTLGQAAAELQVTRKTLDKWLGRLQIEPQRHHADWRYHTITEEQVQQIRAARAEMPGMAPVVRPVIPSPLPALPATPALPPPVQRVYSPRPRADDTLPVGWIAFSGWARSHGLNGQERTMVRLWQDGRFPAPQISEEGWRHNGATIKSAYTEAQHLAASRIAAARWPAHFVARSCPLCREADLTADVTADGADADADAGT